MFKNVRVEFFESRKKWQWKKGCGKNGWGKKWIGKKWPMEKRTKEKLEKNNNFSTTANIFVRNVFSRLLDLICNPILSELFDYSNCSCFYKLQAPGKKANFGNFFASIINTVENLVIEDMG